MATSPAVLEIIHGGAYPGETVALADAQEFVIGTDGAAADFAVAAPHASRKHLTLKCLNGAVHGRDWSTNGTFVNGLRMATGGWQEIASGSRLTFGRANATDVAAYVWLGDDAPAQISDAPPAEAPPTADYRKVAVVVRPSTGGAGRSVPLDGKTEYILGSDPNSADVVVKDFGVSRKHAVIRPGQDGKLEVCDCSTNGTYINGVRASRQSWQVLEECPAAVHLGNPAGGSRSKLTIYFGGEPPADADAPEDPPAAPPGPVQKATDAPPPLSAESSDEAEESTEPAADVCWGMNEETAKAPWDRFVDFKSGHLDVGLLRKELTLDQSQEAAATNLQSKYARVKSLANVIRNWSDADRANRKDAIEQQLENARDAADAAEAVFAEAMGWSDWGAQAKAISKKIKAAVEAQMFDESDEFFDRTGGDAAEFSEDLRQMNGHRLRQLQSEIRVQLETVKMEISDSGAAAAAPSEAAGADDDAADPLDAYMMANAKRVKLEQSGILERKRARLEEKLAAVGAAVEAVQRRGGL